MPDRPETDVTKLLDRVRSGDEAAMPVLLELAYVELRAIAGGLFKNQPRDHTLEPTALVNELCIRLLGASDPEWNDRKHFVRAAARAMRNLLTDHARARRAQRRSNGLATVSLTAAGAAVCAEGVDLLILDETLTRLAAMDQRLGETFELRFLAGLPVERVADLLGVSERTVEVDSKFIRAWLKKELNR